MCKDMRNKARGLSCAAEATLFWQAQAGHRDSLNVLMARHDGLVQAVVRRQVLGELPYEEAMQAGREGLWQAIRHYAVGRGLAFSTYAWPAIMRHVWRAVKRHARSEVRASWNMAGEFSPPVLLEEAWEAHVVQVALHTLVKRLPARLRQVVEARYGLAGPGAVSYAEIGRELGLSRERVRQLHQAAMVWLSQPAQSYQLRSLLERHTWAEYVRADELAQAWLRRRGGRREP